MAPPVSASFRFVTMNGAATARTSAVCPALVGPFLSSPSGHRSLQTFMFGGDRERELAVLEAHLWEVEC